MTFCALAAIGMFSTATMATDLPDMKAGLWESSTIVGKTPQQPVHATVCMNNDAYRRLNEKISKNPNLSCKNISSQHVGPTYTTTTQCQFGNGKPSVSTTALTMSGNTAYHSETRDQDHSVEMMIDAKFVGVCPSGMKLGDMTGPDGKIMMNVLE